MYKFATKLFSASFRASFRAPEVHSKKHVFVHPFCIFSRICLCIFVHSKFQCFIGILVKNPVFLLEFSLEQLEFHKNIKTTAKSSSFLCFCCSVFLLFCLNKMDFYACTASCIKQTNMCQISFLHSLALSFATPLARGLDFRG